MVFLEKATELPLLARAGKTFSVAVVPATLPDAGMWAMWGQLRLLNPRPEILMYARGPNFRVWSGVLEAGGYDVLAEPFSVEELYQAVIKAKLAFEQRVAQEAEDRTAEE